MDIVIGSTITEEPGPETRFTGSVSLKRMIEEAAPGGVRLYFVRFEPGGRTFWHYHDGQQLLVVTEGSCQVQKRGGPVVELGVGDVARFEAGEEHWHGAAGEAPMEHSAITAGTKTHWLQEVD